MKCDASTNFLNLSSANAWWVVRKQQPGTKKHRHKNGAVQKTKLHIPSFPSTGGADISICALEAF